MNPSIRYKSVSTMEWEYGNRLRYPSDSPEQFQIDGGDDSSSVMSEDGKIEEKKDESGEVR